MLEADRLTCRIGKKCLIQEISLTFKPGILYGILGPNGSGKSTLLKTLSGIWKPTKGDVRWMGGPLLNASRKEISRTISLVPQNPQVHFDFSVEEMVRMGRYPLGCTHCREELEAVLKTVDAWHLRRRSILCLSQGERKRVYIARALITQSPVLLLDEPGASLDMRHQLEIWNLLKTLASQKKTVIVANHDLTATRRFCDAIAVLDQGICIGQGKYEILMTQEHLLKVFRVVESPTLRTASFHLGTSPDKPFS